MPSRHCRVALILTAVAAGPASAQALYPFQDPNLDLEKRIDNVLSLMTLDEKIESLSPAGVVVPRLGIRGTRIGEALSGVVFGGPMQTLAASFPGAPPELRAAPPATTQFPQGVGLARTWDPALLRQAGAVIGSEARYIFENGKSPRAFLVLLTPNADLARDPRWGRTQESYGEDAYFNGTMAAALIRGIQGDHPRYWQAASLLKHFLANSNESNRYGSSSNFDVRLLREYYSVPFRMGFVEGGARCYMASYNAWNGVPLTVHPILKDLTVKEWGVDGIICTDAGSLGNLVRQHKSHPDLPQAAAASIKAGINMFLAIFEDYKGAVRGALAENRLTESDLDAVLRGSLRVAFRLGLLDPPELVPYSTLRGAPDPVNSPEHNAVAKQVARESIVLLKNASGLLPLQRQSLRSVAVVGALADTVLPDFYGGTPPYTVTPLTAIQARLGPAATVSYSADNKDGAAAKAARSADVAIVFVGNHPTCGRTPQELLAGLIQNGPCADAGENMEGADRSSLDLTQEQLLKDVYTANPRTVAVLVSSAPYAINWTQANVPAILHTSHNGQEEGNAIADVLFGDYNPAGRLVQTWVRSVAQLPPMLDYDLRHGRTYLYFKDEPLYPFGYGLSYTSFAYSGLTTSAARMGPAGEITVTLDVKNTGNRAGDEVVQLYVRHEASKVERPRKELRGFERVSLAAGETKAVRLKLQAASLAYWDDKASRFVVEEEPVTLVVGGSSSDARLETTVVVSR